MCLRPLCTQVREGEAFDRDLQERRRQERIAAREAEERAREEAARQREREERRRVKEAKREAKRAKKEAKKEEKKRRKEAKREAKRAERRARRGDSSSSDDSSRRVRVSPRDLWGIWQLRMDNRGACLPSCLTLAALLAEKCGSLAACT